MKRLATTCALTAAVALALAGCTEEPTPPPPPAPPVPAAPPAEPPPAPAPPVPTEEPTTSEPDVTTAEETTESAPNHWLDGNDADTGDPTEGMDEPSYPTYRDPTSGELQHEWGCSQGYITENC